MKNEELKMEKLSEPLRDPLTKAASELPACAEHREANALPDSSRLSTERSDSTGLPLSSNALKTDDFLNISTPPSETKVQLR